MHTSTTMLDIRPRRPVAAAGRRPAIAVSAAVHLLAAAALIGLVVPPHLPPARPQPAIALAFLPPTPMLEPLPAATLDAAPAALARDLGALAQARIDAVPSAGRHAGATDRPQRPTLSQSAVAAAPQPLAAQPSPAAAPPAPAPTDGFADAIAALKTRLHRAAQAAAIYPPAARLMHREGRAQIRFDYADGVVSAVTLALSSESSLLDDAALAAIRHAAIPAAPAALAGRKLTLLVWVDFGLTAAD